MKVNERFYWVAQVLDVQPADCILEIGCGHGIAVEQIAGKLISGHILGIDRSATMIRMAEKKNRPFIDSGKAAFRQGNFSAALLSGEKYGKIFAFNVGLFFWKDATEELQVVKAHLAPGGVLYLFYQIPPPEEIQTIRRITRDATEQLEKAGFEIIRTLRRKMDPATSACIIALPLPT